MTFEAFRSRFSRAWRQFLAAAVVLSLLQSAGLSEFGTQRRCANPRAEQRPLPLRHFPWSRQVQQDRSGFYYQPTGIGEDYPESSATAAKMRHDFHAMREAGVKLLRFGVAWDRIETSPGQFNWRPWDLLVNLASQYGVTLMPYVCYTPRWLAQAGPDSWRQPPGDPRRFGDFMEAITRRYKAKIHSWELWNEPDNRDFWQGTVEQFAQMVLQGARGVRRADPAGVVVLGGMARGRSPFLEELLTRFRIGDTVDVVNLHGYLETWENARAEAYPTRIRGMADMLPSPGGPDLWMAEFGYSNYRFSSTHVAAWDVDAIYDYEHTPRYQAVALFKHHVLALAAGRLSLTAWYRINDLEPTPQVIGDANNRYLGILDRNGRPKPAFYALRFFNRLFDRATCSLDAAVRVQAPLGSQSQIHAFEKKGGDVIIVGWLRSSTRAEVNDKTGMASDTRRETVTITLPCADLGKLVVYDARGHRVPHQAVWRDGALRQVVLTGSDLFIAALRATRGHSGQRGGRPTHTRQAHCLTTAASRGVMPASQAVRHVESGLVTRGDANGASGYPGRAWS